MPDGNSSSFRYADNGNLVLHTKPLQQVTCFGYGALSRLTSLTDGRSNGIRCFHRWNMMGILAGLLAQLDPRLNKAQRGFSVPFCFQAWVFFLLLTVLTGCASHQTRIMETTAYCGCGQCCSWERGSWICLKLNFWDRYVSEGSAKGRVYTGKTASNTDPVEPKPGLVSTDSLTRPWMIPVRTIFPWLWLQRDGTIAADTKYYPFGTRMYIPGWGWGVVSDRGGAIKGATRIDLYFETHQDALVWGRRNIEVIIE